MSRLSFIKLFTEDLHGLRRLAPFLGHLKPLLALSLILGLLSSLVETVTVGIVIFLVFKSLSADLAVPAGGLASRFFDTASALTGDSIVVIWAVIVFAVLVKSAIRGAYSLLGAYINNTLHHRIRSALFEKYMLLPYRNLAKLDYGTMANALQVECWYVPEVVNALSGIVMSVCAIAVYMAIIMFFSWPLAMMVVLTGIVIKILLAFLKYPLRRLGFEVTDLHEKLSLRMLTRMQALKTIRAHGLEDSEMKSFSSLSKDVARAFMKMSAVDAYIRPAYDASILTIIAALIWFSAVIGNPVALTATVIALLYRLQPYIFGLEGALMTIAKSQGPLQAILRQLDAKDIRSEDQGALPLAPEWHCLRFENVSFSYDDKNTILESLSFELPRGRVLAISGISGAGKSTLAGLLLKLTSPTGGRILLDDTDFTQINRKQWLATVAAAGQDFELLDGTLHENLTLGRDIPEDVLHESLEIAAIRDFVDTLPEGLQTRVGERGVRLSGGQRQRIVLARALAFNPSFLIMDEATSAVSMDVEERIYRTIKASRPGLTIVLITHRPVPEGFADAQVRL